MRYEKLMGFVIFLLLIMSGLILVGITSVNADSCIVTNNADQTVTQSTMYRILLNKELYDPNDMHYSNNCNVTIQHDGIYLITFNCLFLSAAGIKYVGIMLNQTSYLGEVSSDSTGEVSLSAVFHLSKYSNISSYCYTDVSGQKIMYYSNYSPMLTITETDNMTSGGDIGQTTNNYYDMTTEQFDLMISILGALLSMVSLMMAIRLWHFVGGDG